MNQEIIERLSQIARGEVPTGYQKTKVGIVPEEWAVVPLSKCTQKKTIKNTNMTYSEVFTNSAKKGIIPQNEHFDREIVTECNLYGYYIVENWDFVYNPRISNSAPCGPIGVNHLNRTGVMSPLYTVFRVICDNTSKIFLEYYFSSTNWHYYVKSVSNYGVRHDRMNISDRDFYAIPILSPPLPEQQKIAQILSTQDKVLQLKEKLLEQKKEQKKYLMQQLLTGKKRLEGFCGEWESPKGKKLFTSNSIKNHEHLQVLSATQDKGVVPRDSVDIDIKYDENSLSSYKKVKKGNFVISLRSFQGGIEYSDFDGIISPAYVILELSENNSAEFYKYYLKMPDYIQRLNTAVYGIRDGKQISYSDFGTIQVHCPPLPEQEAIANILTTADKEIDLLQKDVDQEKLKKKSLMQLLLTGIVRVKP